MVIVGAYLIIPEDPDRRKLAVNLIDAVAWFMGGVVLLAMRERKAARSSGAVGVTLLIGSFVIGLVFVSGLMGPAATPGFADLLFLLPLVTLVAGFGTEIRHHVPSGDRRELATDAALIVSALMAAGYVLIRPEGATPGDSASAVTFALVSAFFVATYPALAIWVPTRAHVARAVVFAGLGAAIAHVRLAVDTSVLRRDQPGHRAADRAFSAGPRRHLSGDPTRQESSRVRPGSRDRSSRASP